MDDKFTFKKLFRALTDSKSLKWLVRSARPQWFNIIALTVLNIILAAIAVFNSYMLRNVIDSAIGKSSFGALEAERLRGILFWGVLFGALVLTRVILSIVSNHLVFRINARLTIELKSSLYKNILKKNYSSITKFHTGEMLNRLNNDINTIVGAITSLIPGLTLALARIVGIFFVLLSIDPWFTVAFLAVGVFVFLVSSFFKKYMKEYHKQIMETDGKIRSFMQETLSSLLVIKVFSSEDKVCEAASELQEANYKRKAKRNIISLVTNGSFSVAFNAAYLFGLIYCAVKIAQGDPFITYGTLSQVLSLISQISAPINSLSGVLPMYYSAIGSAERIMEFEAIEDEIAVNDSNIDFSSLYENLDTIEFKDITFRYDRDLIFDRTSLTINKGDLIVMTGISGIGKSTLTKLLLGVFPIECGEIYLSLKDGSKITVDCNLRKLFSYVPQGNFLLSGTIRENIAFIKEDATEDEIREAIGFACADFIYTLPDRLETVIGEKGMGLSEGQIQRIAIARAFLSGAPVILLDEATSALDEATELRLLENIRKLSDKTCILISHKKAANSLCNKEVRIIDGKIVVIDLEHKS
ncbi:MAG: ABC transporter ATP-binding protein [Ruminococcus sp.]|nr:ABC transporter ATP-binding protein [Ruminococcus sp.]